MANSFFLSFDLILAVLIWVVTGKFGYTSAFFIRLMLFFIIAYAIVPVFLEFSSYPLLYESSVVHLRLLSSFILFATVLFCCIVFSDYLRKSLPSSHISSSSLNATSQGLVLSPVLSLSLFIILLLFPIGLLVSSNFSWTSASAGIGRNIAAYIKLIFVCLIAICISRSNGRSLWFLIFLSSLYMFVDQSRTFFFQICAIVFIVRQPRLSLRIAISSILLLVLMLVSGALRHSSITELSLSSLLRPLIGELLWGSFSFSSAIISLSNDQYWQLAYSHGINIFTLSTDIINHYISPIHNIDWPSLSSFKEVLYSSGVLQYSFAPLEGSFFPADFILIFGIVGGSFLSVVIYFSLYILILHWRSSYSLKVLQLSTLPIFLKSTFLDFSKYFVATSLIALIVLASLSIQKRKPNVKPFI